jgi:peptidoglycan hydrolase-like protein with peptidoglycan-binding domain
VRPLRKPRQSGIDELGLQEVESAAPVVPRRRRRRSRWAIAVAVVVIAGVVVFALLAGGTGKQSAAPQASTHYATVDRTDLVATTSFNGTVASQAGPQVINRTNGTVTGLATDGSTISRGKTLYSVNGQPVVLLYGALPAWRDIGGPRITDGADTQQLESNLAALGYDPGTVDNTFTSATSSAIEAWQTAVGLPSDGIAHLGQIVFAPGAVRTDQITKAVGSPVRDGEQIMSTLSSNKIVTVSLDANNANALSGGDAVSIVKSDGTSLPATVTAITASSGGGGGGGGSTATVTPKSASALSSIKDGTAITVNLVTDSRKNVLAVPVTALLARASGGYNIQVVRGGTTVLVGVTPGLYANDLVEVSGDLHEGDRVVVP